MAEINTLVLDVDGVLTDGKLLYGGCTEPLRAFHVHDGFALHWFAKLGGTVAMITAKESLALETRAAELGIRHVVQGSRDKAADLQALLERLDVAPEHVAAVGDDLPDVGMLLASGYPIAVANAVAEVKAIARYVSKRPGGEGAVREIVEHLTRRDGRWDKVLQACGASQPAPRP